MLITGHFKLPTNLILIAIGHRMRKTDEFFVPVRVLDLTLSAIPKPLLIRPYFFPWNYAFVNCIPDFVRFTTAESPGKGLF